MTDPRREGVRGTVAAVGYVIERGLLGEDAARQRVLQQWEAGARLRALDGGGRWLLLLPTPREVRAERAPGVPVVAADSGPGAGPGAVRGLAVLCGERLEERRGGTWAAHDLEALQAIDPSAWLDVAARAAATLAPADVDPDPAPLPRAPETDPEPGPDVRALAKLAQRAADVQRLLDRGTRPGPRLGGGAGGTGGGGGMRVPGRDLVARLVLRSPAGGVVGRRHARYLDTLSRAFERRDYDTALRDAVGFGAGTGWLSLRVPRPRRGDMRPSAGPTSAGGSVGYGPTVQQHLTEMYKKAAARLERDGQLERAAFVYTDLLNAPADAVALLERHGRHALAARIAQGHKLDADLVVRLWWRAGEHRRAIAVARTTGAWAQAVQRLTELDAVGALELRGAWVRAERAAGAHLAAIEAAWPDPDLRATIGPDLAALDAAGGALAATGLAYRVALRADDDAIERAVALLREAGTAPAAPRRAFVEAFAARPAAGAAADRRLATEAVRALWRDGNRAGARRERHLLERADPLLRADRPRQRPARPERRGIPRHELPAAAGATGISDAVVLDAGVLVAAGGRGLWLLTPEGRVKARWDVAATGLVVADHGGVVLAVAEGQHARDLHRLDLATRRVRHVATIAERIAADSFDGAVVLLADDDGQLLGLDVAAAEPEVVWSGLETGAVLIRLARDAAAMAALVDVPSLGRRVPREIQRWRWAAPRRLRDRAAADFAPADAWALCADGTVLRAEDEGDLRLEIRKPPYKPEVRTPMDEDAFLGVAGRHSYVVMERGDGALSTTLRSAEHAPVAEVLLRDTEQETEVRVHGDRATVWTPDGRVAGVDLSDGRLVASLRTPA